MDMFRKYAVRDAMIVAAAILAWWTVAGLSAGDGPVADLAGVVAGLLVGASAFVLHEWGHLLAGCSVGGIARPNTHLKSGFLFSFDSERNSLAQFLVMSVGGFAVTGVFIWIAYYVLPTGLLATRVARGAIAFQASLTLFLELPLVGIALVKGATPAEASVKLGSASEPVVRT